MWSVYCKLGHPDKRHGRNWGERGAGKRTSFRDHIVGHNWALRVDGQISKGTDNGLKYISDPVELAPLTAKPASKLVWDIYIYQSMTTCILSSSGGTFNETVLREPPANSCCGRCGVSQLLDSGGKRRATTTDPDELYQVAYCQSEYVKAADTCQEFTLTGRPYNTK